MRALLPVLVWQGALLPAAMMHDPIQTYTFSEVMRVEHLLEELDYRLLEELLYEYDILA